MPFTQLYPNALPGARYGSFSGKGGGGGPISAAITQLIPSAIPGRRYGDFSGRVPSGFPTQYDGLLYWDGAVWQSLCLVAEADAPAGMGAAPLVAAAGVFYAAYLVETTDPDASPVYLYTTTGWKAVRFKT